LKRAEIKAKADARHWGRLDGVRTKLSTCSRKARFGSAEEALGAAVVSGLPLQAYRCDRCRRFHLTSRTKGKRIKRPA
jgi:hypothetical protein